jgi:hypothetical protein
VLPEIVIISTSDQYTEGVRMGRGILLWLLGIPIPILLILYLFHVV